ncbi:hypothetical protein F4561_003639 [Lipingzhangella halophila]|uniref:Uncharacterized protein n=1 Tax=Lipingzhangella halophila TaxID=1783352 RepID=A0A7W7W4G3_9ACTN|nr:hypothetical protein [Lipingzhangella halophila]
MVRGRGTFVQAGFAVAAMPVHPLRGTCPRYAHFSGYVGDRAHLAALDEAATALDGQRRITVGHESKSFQRLDESLTLLIIAGRGLLSSCHSDSSVNDLPPRNS